MQSNLRWVNAFYRNDNKCNITDYDPSWATGDEQKPLLKFKTNNSDKYSRTYMNAPSNSSLFNVFYKNGFEHICSL